jgi:imidazolonepropionase-like amidohydrolase
MPERSESLAEVLGGNGGSMWLRVGTLVDGVGTSPINNAHVVYDERAIQFVGESSPPAKLLRAGQTAPDADLPKHTLLPGLIEAHAHLFLEGGELEVEKRNGYLKQNRERLLEHAKGRLEKIVRLGVIGIRDAGDKDGVGLGLSKLYASETRPLMPYLDSPGAAIHHQGRYGSFMADALENHASPEECVAARVQLGADRIKLIATGIINFQKGQVTTEPQMTSEEVSRLVGAAQSFGKQTFAHASGERGLDRAIDGKVDSVEHGFFIRDDQLARLRDEQIAWVPTFAPVQAQIDHAARMGWDEQVISNLKRILENHSASLVKAQELGVQVVAGSDAGSYGVPHAVGLLYELELMERAGLSSLAVINTATGNSARRFGYKEKFGIIRAGYRSRFILTEHSPLERIANLRKPKVVVFDGVVVASAGQAAHGGL